MNFFRQIRMKCGRGRQNFGPNCGKVEAPKKGHIYNNLLLLRPGQRFLVLILARKIKKKTLFWKGQKSMIVKFFMFFGLVEKNQSHGNKSMEKVSKIWP